MAKFEFMNSVGRSFSMMNLKLKKHSPEILIGAGIVGVVASAVMACKATTKLNDIMEKTKEDVELIHWSVEHPDDLPEEYTVEDSKKDLAIVYAKTGLELVKLYAPAVALGALSITGILASNNILRKRNVALAAAYTVVDKSFKDYRGRVVERFGEAMDKELRFNIKAKEVEETVVDENGEEKVVKKTVNTAQRNEYTYCYTNGCAGWDKDPDYNKMFLMHQQAHANDLLNANGYLFLNDVLDMLGFPRTKMGQAVGWLAKDIPGCGDGYVDFGVFDMNDPSKVDFVNGWESSIWLDFNVDGVIWDKI